MVKKALFINGSSVEVAPEPTIGRYLQRNAADSEYEWTNAVLQAHERLNPTAAQTEFNLVQTPLDGYAVQMFVNGLKQTYDEDYIVDDSIVDYIGILTLGIVDTVEFFYQYVETPAQIDDLELWYEGDFEGAETETSSPTVYTSIPNRGGYGGTFSSSATKRPTFGYLESGGVLKNSIIFDGSNDAHTSSLPASSWAQAHQAWTWSIAFKGAGTTASTYEFLVSTRTSTASQVGVTLTHDRVNEKVTLWLANGSIYVANTATPNGSVPIGDVVIVTVSYSDSAGYDIRVNGTSVISAALGGATSSSNPNATINIGESPAGSSPFSGQIFGICGYSRVLETSEIEIIEKYLSAKYQRQAAPGQYAPTIWYRSDLGLELRAEEDTDGYVSTWRDISGNAHDASQNTGSEQPPWIPRDADFQRPSLETDYTKTMDVSSGARWSSGVNHSLIAVINPEDVGTTYKYLLDSETGRLIFAIQGTPIGQAGFYDGAWRACGVGAAGEQVLEWHLDDSNGLGSMYRDGVFIGSATYAGGVSFGGDVSLFSRYNGAASFCAGAFAELIHRDSLIENADLYSIRNYLDTRYSFSHTPLEVPGHESWIDPTDASEWVTTGSYTGTELLVDGDMEKPGVSDWDPIPASVVLAKLTGDPYEGNRYLRVTKVDGTGFWTIQSILATDVTYRISGVARSNGVALPTVIANWGVTAWQGTTSTAWQPFEVNIAATGSYFGIGGPTGSPGDYVEFDNLSVVEVEPAVIGQDKSRNLADPLTNGDFELVDGPDDWTAGSGAVLTALGGTRTGGGGDQILRIETILGDTWGSATQTVMSIGTQYRITGWARGDGVNGYPRVYDSGGPILWTGTTSATWQSFDVTFVTTGTAVTLNIGGLASTENYAEFDDVILTDASEELTNGDFESGSPPSDWAPYWGAVLSAQAGARTGGSGTQYLRVTSIATKTITFAESLPAMTAGVRYLITGWARGDGVNGYPNVTESGGTGLWTGTTSTAWQYFSIDYYHAVGANLWLISRGNAATSDDADFDDVSIIALPEQLINGDFETGSPPDNWFGGAGTTLTSQAGARTGGSGAQFLRVAILAADADGNAYQTALVIGDTYRVSGWARGDGVNGYPKVSEGGVTWTGSTSIVWQFFSFEFVASGNNLDLQVIGDLATADYAEFDDVSLIREDLLTNGNFELPAEPIENWSINSGSILTARAGARTSGTGSTYLRVGLPLDDNLGSAIQNTTTIGTRYRVNGWARGDGVNGSPRLYVGATEWTGTTSNTWQEFDVAFISSGTNVTLACDGDTDTNDYAEFDEMTCVPSNDCYQETEANRPVLFDGYLWFTIGNEQYLEWIIPDPDTGTIWGWLWVDDLSAGAQSLCGSWDGTDRCAIATTLTGTIEFGLGTVYNATTATIAEGAWNFIACTWEAGAHKIYLNGSDAEIFAETTTASPNPLFVGARDWNGTPNRFLGGRIGDFGILNRVATAEEIEAIRQSNFRS